MTVSFLYYSEEMDSELSLKKNESFVLTREKVKGDEVSNNKIFSGNKFMNFCLTKRTHWKEENQWQE